MYHKVTNKHIPRKIKYHGVNALLKKQSNDTPISQQLSTLI